MSILSQNKNKNIRMISFSKGTKEFYGIKDELYFEHFKNIIQSELQTSKISDVMSVFNESFNKLIDKILKLKNKDLSFEKTVQLLNKICYEQINIHKKVHRIKKTGSYVIESSRRYEEFLKIHKSTFEKINKEEQRKNQTTLPFDKKVEELIWKKRTDISLEKTVSTTLNVLKDSKSYYTDNKKQKKYLDIEDFLVIILHDLLNKKHDDVVSFFKIINIYNFDSNNDKKNNNNIRQRLSRSWIKLKVLVNERIKNNNGDGLT